jgi:hypothetical protein
MKLGRRSVEMLILSAVAICLTAGFASAQVISRGSFSLSNDAQWGKKVLPKGNYNFTVRETGMMGVTVTMTSADKPSHEFELMGMQRTADASLKGSGSTVIVTHGRGGDILESIYLAGNDVEYTFPVNGKKNAVMANNSSSRKELTMRVPIRTPK